MILMCLHSAETYGKLSQKREMLSRKGIISTDRCTENCIKLRINAADKNASNAQDKAIADAYGNIFIIPLECACDRYDLYGARL